MHGCQLSRNFARDRGEIAGSEVEREALSCADPICVEEIGDHPVGPVYPRDHPIRELLPDVGCFGHLRDRSRRQPRDAERSAQIVREDRHEGLPEPLLRLALLDLEPQGRVEPRVLEQHTEEGGDRLEAPYLARGKRLARPHRVQDPDERAVLGQPHRHDALVIVQRPLDRAALFALCYVVEDVVQVGSRRTTTGLGRSADCRGHGQLALHERDAEAPRRHALDDQGEGLL